MAALLLCTIGEVSATPVADAPLPTCRGVSATIVGTDADDVLTGTDGDDVIVGGEGLDQILAGAGDDLICGGSTHPRSHSEGRPWAQVLRGGPGNDTLVGGSGPDLLWGSLGDDLLLGNGGADSLSGGAGADTLHGGTGADNLSGSKGTDRVFGGPGADALAEWRDAKGENELDGGDGPDILRSAGGNEDIRGGKGRDTVSYAVLVADWNGSQVYEAHDNDITADLRERTAHGAGFGTDHLHGIENVSTSSGNDVLIGDDGPNTFYPGSGSREVGAESITDSVDGNGGPDRIVFDSLANDGEPPPGPVHVDLARRLARWQRIDTSLPPIAISLVSIENVTGSGYEDVLLGDAQPNTLSGGPYGGDVISGRRGADQLYGGRGPDVLFGRHGNDRLGGGPGRNRNDGGTGTDTCRLPRRGPHALRCER